MGYLGGERIICDLYQIQRRWEYASTPFKLSLVEMSEMEHAKMMKR